MRNLPFLLVTIITFALIYALNTRWGTVPALGSFLSPQQGFWQNAEGTAPVKSSSLQFNQLNGESKVYFDERMVPHIFAASESDAYFIQGFIHAKFRLWQMEMQTFAAAGRVSEVAGSKTIQFDRQQRRLGMVYAAQKMLKEIEANPVTKLMCDQYTAGVNAYIESLDDRGLPLEYKLLGYRPEKWSNLKSALFVKQMTKTLASNENDLSMTYAKNFFNDAQLKVLFPQLQDSLDPIVPAGTTFQPATINPLKPADADSAYINNYNIIQLNETDKPNPANGSNNWAVSGSKTKSGKPILANDPHLDMTLPSVWFEMQIVAGGMNVYGASFPGCPAIVIGFNDQVAWGVTNAGRDVRDYYEVNFRDRTKQEYRFNNEWKKTDSLVVERFLVKDAAPVFDTIAFLPVGPVLFDNDFNTALSPGKAYAVRWMAHEPSNELMAFNKLNHARNYSDYLEAIQYMISPAQNFAFASVDGDIAIWQQGRFPARWKDQGIYIMPYTDNRYEWQGYIPSTENPHQHNPARGFVSSANQRPAAGDYPYFIPGLYDLYRGKRINQRLSALNNITAEDMMNLQKDNQNLLAATAVPLFTKHLDRTKLGAEEKAYADTIMGWNYDNDPGLVAPTIFKIWYDSLENFVWQDELKPLHAAGLHTSEATLIEALIRDSSFTYIDNMNTKEKETLSTAITETFKKAVTTVEKLAEQDYQRWAAYKNTTIYHLLGQQLLPFARTGLPIGGGTHVVNATQHNHGPSWKMVVEMTTPKTAWVIYPGGQSGNPGSKYYDNFVDDYAAGKYYRAWIMEKAPEGNNRVVSTMSFSK